MKFLRTIPLMLFFLGIPPFMNLSYAENKIDLKQAGFSRIISLTATNFPLLYGILAVILSGSLGWLISTIFRRLKIS